ncbi:MAG: alpha-beta hydrolase superfamily lysophospholipase [Flavobacteriales bacterium]|jgi:alpha-beta hydrolase superfamily lysophospholipase
MTSEVKPKRKKLLRKALLVFLAISIIGGILGFFFIGPYFILQPPSYCTENNWPAHTESLMIPGARGINLSVKHTSLSDQQPEAVVILIHGIGACKEIWPEVADRLARRGFASFSLDLRAHGASGGDYCTFGFHEKADISKVVDYIESLYPNTPIGVWGHSLGGAIALQSLDNDDRLDFGVIESTFTSFHQIVYDYHQRHVGFVFEPLVDLALSRAGALAEFTPELVSPIQSVTRIEQPVIIAHGELDKNIDFKYGRQLFEELKSAKKVFYLAPGAGHNNMHMLGGEEYLSMLIDFVEGNIPPH